MKEDLAETKAATKMWPIELQPATIEPNGFLLVRLKTSRYYMQILQRFSQIKISPPN